MAAEEAGEAAAFHANVTAGYGRRPVHFWPLLFNLSDGEILANGRDALHLGDIAEGALSVGKTLNQWKLRWYTVSVEGDLVCYRRRTDLDESRPPMFAVHLSQLRVTMLPPERLERQSVLELTRLAPRVCAKWVAPLASRAIGAD